MIHIIIYKINIKEKEKGHINPYSKVTRKKDF